MYIPTNYNNGNTSSIFICPICGHTKFHKLFTCTDHFVSGEDVDIVRCDCCKLRITRSFSTKASLADYYRSDNYISHSNTRKGATNRIYHIARKLMLKKKRKWIEKHISGPEKNLLDVGCGTGYFPTYMQKYGWNVLGVEKSDTARTFVRENFEFEVAPSLSKISTNSQFNIITLWHVLEHLEDLNHAIQSFNRLLTSQGALFIAVPNYKSADAEKYRAHWAAYDVPRHLWHFSPVQMGQLAKKHGFRITAIKPFYLDGFYISILSEKYKGSSISLLKGALSGLNTFFSTLVNIKKSSSLLYVLKKM